MFARGNDSSRGEEVVVVFPKGRVEGVSLIPLGVRKPHWGFREEEKKAWNFFGAITWDLCGGGIIYAEETATIFRNFCPHFRKIVAVSNYRASSCVVCQRCGVI